MLLAAPVALWATAPWVSDGREQPKVRLESDAMGDHICPYCSYKVLCHVRSGRLHWRCGHCRTFTPID
jgi:ribosomal protein L37AE/L43A